MADEHLYMPTTSEITIPESSIEPEYESIGIDTAQCSTTESKKYKYKGKDQFTLHIHNPETKESEVSSPFSDFSTYHNPYTEEGIHSPGAISKLSYTGSMKSKHPHTTRQLNVFIGEELEENFQSTGFPTERKAYSCPTTPRAVKRTVPLSREPIEVPHLGAERPHYENEPVHFFIYNLPEEEQSVYNEFLVKSNPHNRINHMIHSALHCPCFFFFFLLCCMPGVHWMQLGDKAYKNGDVDEAKFLGRKATVSYFVGAVLGVLVLAGVIMISVYFVQDQLDQ
ncbi:uncharacterized protein LOC133179626 [Saccostrea echinata]|uniref:uncharacterized protein LOC133179626 n=1 Tax=Saccostrea echinata TaxID=191078 RepID=UPI002A83FDE8|nr:uncharacterized protein LOC133179626 [Saccostrea echinata]